MCVCVCVCVRACVRACVCVCVRVCIPGISVVRLVINKELCQVVWGIVINNFMHKHSFVAVG